MFSLVLSLLIMQVTAPATTVPSPPAGWTSAPLDAGLLDHFTRTEGDGTVATLLVRRQVCDCQPEEMSDMLEHAVRQVPGAIVARDSLQVCGQKAYRVIVTGLATAPARMNMVVLAFRSGDALVMQQYTFTQAQPAADAVTTLEGLCPQ
jgi:hypothetical protein